MDFVTAFFAIAVAWFSFIFFRIATWVYEFWTFPGTFGATTNISLNDLAELSQYCGQDVPNFNIVIPAYDESLVIDGTLRRMASINFPQTHFKVWVVTYEDEPLQPGQLTTFATANGAAAEINAAAGRDLVTTLSVPAGFDGRFPGSFDAKDRFVGKPRGLNFAIRLIHERNERDERSFFVGKMARLGRIADVDDAIGEIEAEAGNPAGWPEKVVRFFDPASCDYVGAATLSSQLRRLATILAKVNDAGQPQQAAAQVLASYIAREAPRFFLSVATPTDPSTDGHVGALQIMEDRRFLYDVMCEVEANDAQELVATSFNIETRLAAERPILSDALHKAQDGDRLYHLVRQINSRWLATYDADADVPVDLFRHLAARILTEPDTMGFQGPVSPVANYDEVHPLCGLGGLWLAFWHNTGYPRLFAKKNWAHVLAGTNWCFRLDGLRQGDGLVRDAEYDEFARRFILSFDPGHLTEDLEAGVRMFDEFKVNASWHPYQEFEQVPESKQAMIVQRRRWTLGTLQTIAYMMGSRLPVMQKLKYGFHPLEIVTSGTGPIVTILLIYFIYRGDLISSPATIAWSIVLTFANLMYVVPFLQTYERFVTGFRRDTGAEYLIRSGPGLVWDIKQQLRNRGLAYRELALMHDITDLLEDGLLETGCLSRYLTSRSLDDPPVGTYASALSAVTPSGLRQRDVHDLAEVFSRLTAYAFEDQDQVGLSDTDLIRRLERLKAEMQKASSQGEWQTRRRTERRQIWRWAFVYLFWQLVPSYLGLMDWLRGSKDKTWVKTSRTRKPDASALN